MGYIGDSQFFGSSGLDEIFIAATIWRGVLFMGIGVIIFLVQNWMIMQKEANAQAIASKESALNQSKLALELANARNAYLQAQINPHFMLSSLSYIYDNTRTSAPLIAQTVQHLSKLLRYALASVKGPSKINLNKEIEQVENLIKITRIKKQETFIDFSVEPDCFDTEVIPFLLLSLVENMIKHGDMTDPQWPGIIIVSKQGENIVMETRNKKSDGVNDTGLHTGLFNMEQRLYHSYGNSAQINHGFSDELFFTARIIIPFEPWDLDDDWD